ncbi:hypothetical protein BDN67DRAFT_104676 [Paxillus ammoniavirescens]|nr:hypothetical protein BDN67DRAFT_104676 [Paxillus ammoniavirescens]
MRQDVRSYRSLKGVPTLHLDGSHEVQLKDAMRGCRCHLYAQDQTAHTILYIYKPQTTRIEVYAIADENIAWVLDEIME